jgi:hypothetical protein
VALAVLPATADAAWWRLTGLSGTATYTLTTPSPPSCDPNNPRPYVRDGTWTAGFKLLAPAGPFPYYQVGERLWRGRRIPSGTMADVRLQRNDTTAYTMRTFDAACTMTEEPCAGASDWILKDGMSFGVDPQTNKFGAVLPSTSPLEGEGQPCFSQIAWSGLGKWRANLNRKGFGKKRSTIRWTARAEGDRVFRNDATQHYVAQVDFTATLRRVR